MDLSPACSEGDCLSCIGSWVVNDEVHLCGCPHHEIEAAA